MNPCITDAIGTQKLAEPSSVCHADFATSEKLSIAAISFRSLKCPASYSASEASKGLHVIRSPAEPASSLEFRAALYSVGADGVNFTFMSLCCASKAGIIFSCHSVRSSLRQLSIMSVASSAHAVLVVSAIPVRVAKMDFLIMLPPVQGGLSVLAATVRRAVVVSV